MRKVYYLSGLVPLFYLFLETEAFQNLYKNDPEFSGKFCRFRDDSLHVIYPKEFFNEVTGQACYEYGPIQRFVNNTPYRYKYYGRPYPPNNRVYSIIYGVDVQANIMFPFDYKNEAVKEVVRKSFVKERYFNNWLKCCEQAENCCENSMTNENILPSEDNDTCPALWDGWDCFSPAMSDTEVNNYCPNYIYVGEPPCLKTSVKECFENGTWNVQTDYSTCDYNYIMGDRIIIHSYALFIANILCLPAIVIFFLYPALRITRVILHRNLLIVIVIKNSLVITSKILITLAALNIDKTEENRSTVLQDNGVPCRVLAFFERVAVNAMYACMLVDGFYLHKIIVAVFRKDPPLYLFYIAVAVLSLVPILIWSTLKAVLDNTNCWIVDVSWHHWIIDGSRYLMLGVNLLLLLDIIRVLVWKLQRNNGAQHTKYYYVSVNGVRSFRHVVQKALTSTLRATFILLPLFGLQFIMMSQRPVNASCDWDNVFYYVSYAIDASQGILVSLLYCYFNKEVQTLLERSYQKFKTRFEIRRPTINLRRTTTATYVSEHFNPKNFSIFKKNVKVDPKLDSIPEENRNRVAGWVQDNFNNNEK